jgi:hypothetical protein
MSDKYISLDGEALTEVNVEKIEGDTVHLFKN